MLSMRVEEPAISPVPPPPPYRRFDKHFQSCDAIHKIEKSTYLLPAFSPLSALPDPFWDSFLNQDTQAAEILKPSLSTDNLIPPLPTRRNPFHFPRQSPPQSLLSSTTSNGTSSTPSISSSNTSTSHTTAPTPLSSLQLLSTTSSAKPSFLAPQLHTRLISSTHHPLPLSLTPSLTGAFFVSFTGDWTLKSKATFSISLSLHLPLPLSLALASAPTSTSTSPISALDPGSAQIPSPLSTREEDRKVFIEHKTVKETKEPSKSALKSFEISVSAIVEGENGGKVAVWQKSPRGESKDLNRRVPSLVLSLGESMVDGLGGAAGEGVGHAGESEGGEDGGMKEGGGEGRGLAMSSNTLRAEFERLQLRPIVPPTVVERICSCRVVIEVHAVVMRSGGYGKAERRVKIATVQSVPFVVRNLF